MEVSETRQTGCVTAMCMCARACTYLDVCVVACAYVHLRLCLCVEVGVSVCVSKIINRPQKRVIPLLCVRVDRRGPEEERKC